MFGPSRNKTTITVLWFRLTSRVPILGIHKAYAGCIYTKEFSGHGLYKDVVAYPLYRASYAVPVRPYRLL